MLEAVDLTNVMVIDIETVPQKKNYNELSDSWKVLWDAKSKIKYPTLTPEESYRHAGLYGEFGKIICISLGIFVKWGNSYQLRIKSHAGHDEKALLNEFKSTLEKFVKSPAHTLVAHNGREFDFPFMARRMMINGIELPMLLDIGGRRPWEINLIDTLDLWKFGDFKAYTSLALIAECFNIPTPKDDIDGSMVYAVYYNDNDLDRIKTYCQKDVATLGRVMLKFKGDQDIPEQNIQVV
jgi:predicted PolB exonuclease-like 3'-5' exonuclease